MARPRRTTEALRASAPAALTPLDPASDAGRTVVARLSPVLGDVRAAIAARKTQAARRPA